MRFRLQAYTPKFNPKTDTERELRNCFKDMLLIKRRALENHFESRHPGHEAPKIIHFSLGGKQAPQVHLRLLKDRERHERYMVWLTELVECNNSAHNPCVPGKYFH